MTSRNSLLITAGALTCALLVSEVVEAHGGLHALGATLAYNSANRQSTP